MIQLTKKQFYNYLKYSSLVISILVTVVSCQKDKEDVGTENSNIENAVVNEDLSSNIDTVVTDAKILKSIEAAGFDVQNYPVTSSIDKNGGKFYTV